jgi:uncharacterized protein (TIGR02145 family)
MQENLNIGTRIDGDVSSTNENGINSTIEKYCYDDDDSNCGIYGGLYQWNEAMNYVETEGAQDICPDGWHIPTVNDWQTLTTTVSANPNYICDGDQGCIAKALASSYDWNTHINDCAIGNNQSTNNATGFNALPAGYRSDTGGAFRDRHNYAFFWLSSPYGPDAHHRLLIFSFPAVISEATNRALGFSVRCLKTD